MSRLVMDPRSKYGFEANFNPRLRMSTGTMASVKFKLDKEKAKYEKTLEILNLSEKLELRLAQKQMEEVKKELTLMRAYQHVAKQMAFRNFDPVIRRRRERREKERQEREKEEDAKRRQKQQEKRQAGDGDDDDDDDDDDDGDDGDDDDHNNGIEEHRRRMSSTGKVFVTLQDIIGNDEVLRRNSKEIHEMRRKSQASLDYLEYGDDSFASGGGTRKKSVGNIRSPRRGSLASSVGSSCDGEAVKHRNRGGWCKEEVDDTDGGKEKIARRSNGNLLDVGEGIVVQRRRKSRAGSSFGIVGLDSIEENGLEVVKGKEKDYSLDESRKEPSGGTTKDNKTSSLVVSGRKGFKTTGNLVKGFFITSTDDNEENRDTKSKSTGNGINDNRDKPMSIYQISKYYDKQKSRYMEENKSKELNQQKRRERRKFESLRRRLQKEKFDKDKRSSKKSASKPKISSAPDKRDMESSLEQQKNRNSSPLSNIPKDDDNIQKRSRTVPLIEEPPTEVTLELQPAEPKVEVIESSVSESHLNNNNDNDNNNNNNNNNNISPLKGLARFKNAATAVSVQLTVSNLKKTSSNRLKHIAAAVMMKESPKVREGHSHVVPKAFMYSGDFADRFGRERDKSKATALEASHRKAEDCKIRPLPMPESVKAEYAVKWHSLMGSVNSAVRWKVKALKEDTGTVSSRQIRRQAREDQPSVMSSVSPRSTRNPPRSVFPGACKTTWAVKKFLSQEMDEVLKAWKPENVRRKRNQNMKAKVSFPDFIDRARTTVSILNSFRTYCKEKGEGDVDDEREESDDDDDESDVNSAADDDDNNNNSNGRCRDFETGDGSSGVGGEIFV